MKKAFPFLFIFGFAFLFAAGWLLVDKPTKKAPEVFPVDTTVFYDENILALSESDFLCAYENHLIKEKDRYYMPGAAVAIVKDGEIIYKRAFGYADIKARLPVTPSTVFRIGSVSKGFAAALAIILVEEGQLNLNAPVTNYLPQFKTNPESLSDSITVAHVLSHTTGYQYQAYTTLIEDGLPLEQMVAALQQLPLSRKPGEIHSYQNVAYSLIEMIIESATGREFKALMKEKIFDPLKMSSASLDYQSIMAQPNVALPHQVSRRGYAVSDISANYYNAKAAGGVNASINDMAEWLRAISGYHPDVLSGDVRHRLYTPQVVTAVKNSFLSGMEWPRNGYYGLGWRIIDYPSDTLIYHEGYVNGYKSSIGYSKSLNMGVCILTNHGSPFCSKVFADFFKMAEVYYTPIDSVVKK